MTDKKDEIELFGIPIRFGPEGRPGELTVIDDKGQRSRLTLDELGRQQSAAPTKRKPRRRK